MIRVLMALGLMALAAPPARAGAWLQEPGSVLLIEKNESVRIVDRAHKEATGQERVIRRAAASLYSEWGLHPRLTLIVETGTAYDRELTDGFLTGERVRGFAALGMRMGGVRRDGWIFSVEQGVRAGMDTVVALGREQAPDIAATLALQAGRNWSLRLSQTDEPLPGWLSLQISAAAPLHGSARWLVQAEGKAGLDLSKRWGVETSLSAWADPGRSGAYALRGELLGLYRPTKKTAVQLGVAGSLAGPGTGQETAVLLRFWSRF